MKTLAEINEDFDVEFDICNNPDHGFIDAVGGEIGRLGCPGCDGNLDKEITIKPSRIKELVKDSMQAMSEAVIGEDEVVIKTDYSAEIPYEYGDPESIKRNQLRQEQRLIANKLIKEAE